MSRIIGCKFCIHQFKSWHSLFDHSLGSHPIEYQAVQEWLDRKTLTEQEQLFVEWDIKLA